MVNAICKEIVLQKDFFKSRKISSIYFGGGTPSLLNNNELEQILATINAHFEVEKNAEITLEANPEDLIPTYLQILKRLGINRLSIGMQALDDEVLTWMNRAHSVAQARACVQEAAAQGFDEVSVDLIYGVPNLSDEAWQRTLEEVLDWPINHLSAYSLTLENNTPYFKGVKNMLYQKPKDSDSAQQFDLLQKAIKSRPEWQRYEISNYAKNDKYAQHNTAYWQGKLYLGIGPSAHGFNGNERFANVANNAKYMHSLEKGVLDQQIEVLSEKDIFNEYILTNIRTKWGVNLEQLNELSASFIVDNQQFISDFLKKKWVRLDNNFLSLTDEGALFADYIASELFVI